MSSTERFLNSFIPLIVTLILLVTFGIQVFLHETPCPFCYLQRVGIIAAGIGFLLNLRFGIHMSHYGLVLLSAFFGGFVALRQLLLHVSLPIPSETLVLGLSLAAWSFLIYVAFILAVAALLFLFKPSEEHKKMSRWEKIVTLFFFLTVLGNILSSYLQCELGPCGDVTLPQPKTEVQAPVSVQPIVEPTPSEHIEPPAPHPQE